jgi:hypothetical protein
VARDFGFILHGRRLREALDEEVKRLEARAPGVRVTRSSVARELIAQGLALRQRRRKQ